MIVFERQEFDFQLSQYAVRNKEISIKIFSKVKFLGMLTKQMTSIGISDQPNRNNRYQNVFVARIPCIREKVIFIH